MAGQHLACGRHVDAKRRPTRRRRVLDTVRNSRHHGVVWTIGLMARRSSATALAAHTTCSREGISAGFFFFVFSCFSFFFVLGFLRPRRNCTCASRCGSGGQCECEIGPRRRPVELARLHHGVTERSLCPTTAAREARFCESARVPACGRRLRNRCLGSKFCTWSRPACHQPSQHGFRDPTGGGDQIGIKSGRMSAGGYRLRSRPRRARNPTTAPAAPQLAARLNKRSQVAVSRLAILGSRR